MDIGGYDAWLTRCNVSRDVAHYVSRSVLTFPLTNVCEIRTSATIQMVLIIHVAWKERGLQGCNIISISPKSWSWSQSLILALSMPSFSDHWVDSHDESRSFRMNFLYRSMRSSVSLHIGPISGNSYPLAYLPSIHQRMPLFCPTMSVIFQLQSWTWFTNKWRYG